jgi:hypothetical protein
MRKSNFVILPFVLLLTACAGYQPNVPAAEQAKPTYADDLTYCQHRQEEIAKRMFGPFAILSYAYAQATLTDEEVHESQDAITPEGKKKIIDNCMKQKGYTVTP